MSHTESLEVS